MNKVYVLTITSSVNGDILDEVPKVFSTFDYALDMMNYLADKEKANGAFRGHNEVEEDVDRERGHAYFQSYDSGYFNENNYCLEINEVEIDKKLVYALKGCEL